MFLFLHPSLSWYHLSEHISPFCAVRPIRFPGVGPTVSRITLKSSFITITSCCTFTFDMIARASRSSSSGRSIVEIHESSRPACVKANLQALRPWRILNSEFGDEASRIETRIFFSNYRSQPEVIRLRGAERAMMMQNTTKVSHSCESATYARIFRKTRLSSH